MSDVMYAMIILPIILLVLFNFVFASVNPSLTSLQREITCPWPASSGLWNNTGVITYTNATYNYRAVNINVNTLTCTPVHTVNGVDYNYGQPAVAIGVFFYTADVLSELGHKIGAFFVLMGNFFVYPFQVSGLIWWGYVQLFLTTMLILGIVMIARPSGGLT